MYINPTVWAYDLLYLPQMLASIFSLLLTMMLLHMVKFGQNSEPLLPSTRWDGHDLSSNLPGYTHIPSGKLLQITAVPHIAVQQDLAESRDCRHSFGTQQAVIQAAEHWAFHLAFVDVCISATSLGTTRTGRVLLSN